MKICSVYDAEFARYGRVHSGIESAALLREMEKIPLPESGTAYEPSVAALEACEAFADYRTSVFGGMSVQRGMCWGRNTKLNCLEYHRDSEFNLGLGDFILLLAKQDEIEDGVLDTAKVKAFPRPRRGARGGIRHDAALCPLPHGRNGGLSRARRAAARDEYGKARAARRLAGGQISRRLQQVAARAL